MGNLFLPRAVVETAAERVAAHRLPHAARAGDGGHRGDLSRPRAASTSTSGPWAARAATARIGELWDGVARGRARTSSRTAGSCRPGMTAFNESGTYAPTYHDRPLDRRRGVRAPVPVRRLRRFGRGDAGGQPGADPGPRRLLWPSSPRRSSCRYDCEQHDHAARPRRRGLRRPAGRGCSGTRSTTGEQRGLPRLILRGRATPASRCDKAVITADDFFPEKRWDVMALVRLHAATIPTRGRPACEELDAGHLPGRRCGWPRPRGDKHVTFTLRLMEERRECAGWSSTRCSTASSTARTTSSRPVKISDSGRIRNELQTLCSEALEYLGEQQHAGPLRPHPARGDLAREPDSGCWRSCAGTSSTTRSGSRG